MALPHLRASKARQPEAQLTLIAKPQFKDLIELFPVADEFVPLQKGGFRILRTLSAQGREAQPRRGRACRQGPPASQVRGRV